MEYTTLGATGARVSRLCFGTWRFGRESGGVVETTREEAHRLLDAAYEQGITFIDTSNQYGRPAGTSERFVGEWLAERDREEFFLATKVGNPVGEAPHEAGLSRRHVRWQVESSLENLGTDYLDLYYVHRLDEATPVRELVSTLGALVEEGKVRYLGASTMAAWQLTRLLWEADSQGVEPVTVTQPPVDATLANYKRYEGYDLHRYLEVCAAESLAVCPYSPLAAGFLTGKYERTADGIRGPEGSRGDLVPGKIERLATDAAWRTLEAVREVAGEVDATPAQVSLAWLLAQRVAGNAPVPVVGARTPDQLAENAGAVDLDLEDGHLRRIDEARGESLVVE